MNTSEINGFEIDVFNQHELKVGAKESPCPLCSHTRSSKNQKAKCASLDWDRGLGTCHHCDEVFQLHKFKRKSEKEYVRPKENENRTIDPRVLDYFSGRGISLRTLEKAKVTTRPGWIEFNFYANGELINVKSRNAKKNFLLTKGAEKIFYNLDSTVGHDSVVIVEGEVDVLSLIEAGYDSVVSVPNGATLQRLNLDYLDNCIDYFNDKTKIILATDADEAGENLRAELIRRFGAEVCYTVDFGGAKDANELLVSAGVSAVRAAIDSALEVPLDNVVQLKHIEDEIVEFVEEGFKPGFQVGLPNFDQVFSTYTGQFITVTGIPSSGKSDWVDQMAVGYNINYGWKTAFASPENKPTFLHAHKLIRKFWKGMPKKEDVGTEKWKQVTEHVNDNFYFIEQERYDLDSVLKKGAELVRRKGIRCLVIDPFNKVKMKTKREMSIPDYTMEYLQKIEIFAKKHDVLVIVVAHPTKMYKDANGKIEEPTMYNIKGGGEWYDASYHGLLVHRNYEEKTVKVKVLKVKFQNLGQNGEEAHFKWKFDSGLYEPYEQQVINEVPW